VENQTKVTVILIMVIVIVLISRLMNAVSV